MAHQEPTETQRLLGQGELFVARKELVTRELAYLEELKKLKEAKKPPVEKTAGEQATEAALQEADRLKKQAEADKAVAEAQKARAEAEAANTSLANAKVKALFGEVPGGGTEGGVTAGNDSGVAESALLAAKGLRKVSKTIADDVSSSIGDKEVWLFSQENIPDFGAIITFELKSAKLAKEIRATLQEADDAVANSTALTRFEAATGDISLESVAGLVTGAGAGLDVLSKIGKYFQSQYSVSGVKVPDYSDGPLLDAVAGALATKRVNVYTPHRFHPAFSTEIDIDNNAVFRRLFKLTELLDPLIERRATLTLHLQEDATEKVSRDTALAAASSALAAIKDDDGNAAARRQAQQAKINNIRRLESEWAAVRGRVDVAITNLDAAMAAISDYVDGLTATGANQPRPAIVDLVLESHVLGALRSGQMLLIVNLTSLKGSYYTRRNLWTFLGSIPFYHMAGAVVNYSVIDGATGAVAHAGTLTYHSGFMKSHRVKEAVND